MSVHSPRSLDLLVPLRSAVNRGRPGGIRTPNKWIWNPPLYQLELLAYRQLLLTLHMLDVRAALWAILAQVKLRGVTLDTL